MKQPFFPYDTNKVSIIGCGKVGMTVAFTLLLKGLTNELVLHGRCRDDLIGEELDLEHGLSFLHHTKITATEQYEDIAESDVVIIAAGAAQKPGDTRLDLAEKNIQIMNSIIPQVVKYAPESVIVIVSNPVDVLTYKAYLLAGQLAGFPKGRIFGSGTTLDTSRFRFHLSEFLNLNPSSIHAYILGEHGDSSFPAISGATVGGQALASIDGFSKEKAIIAYEKTRNAAYKIIASKGATYYAIGVAVSHIVDTILRDTKKILPVSVPLHGFYGHYGVALSVPCVIGRRGVEKTLEIKLDWEEKQKLDKSVRTLKSYL